MEDALNNEEIEAGEGVETEQPDPVAEKMANLEKQIADAQSEYGRQSNEIGELRQQLAEAKASEERDDSPNDQAVLDDILGKIDEGELSLQEGFGKALELTKNMTAANVISQMTKMQEERDMENLTNQWHKDNPDFNALINDGSLQPYLDADPMANEVTAYRQYQADQKMKALEEEAQAKVDAAKEEGAKLAQGATNAGKVLGKSGTSAQQAATVTKPFKNTQEATDAMMQTLQQIRSTAG